jgi:hypothetical protein
MRFLQFPRAVVAADFHDMTTERDLDRIAIQPAVAGGTRFFDHDVFLRSLQAWRNHPAGQSRYQDL